MCRRIATSMTTAALLLAVPAVAGAASGSSPKAAADVQLGLPIVQPRSMNDTPPGFSSTAELHRRQHPLIVAPYVWQFSHAYWYITFAYHGRIVAEADVSPAGKVWGVWTGPQAIAPYAHGDYAPLFSNWWVLVPFSVLFLLPFLDPRRLRRLAHLDAVVVLSFLVSYLLLDNAHLESSVWMAYPPLLYLLARLLWLGLRSRGAWTRDRLAPLLSTRVLAGGLLLIVAARVVLTLVSNQEIDVGVASVVGAHRIAHGLPLYFADPGHGDTYGPITYLAYLPFQLLFNSTGSVSNPDAAYAATIFFDLVTILALFFLGRRLRPGHGGTRLGLVLAWAWSACPFTVLAVIVHTNDGLIAMLSVLALLAYASPVARGAILGLAAAAKFSPAALLPLFAAPRRGLKGAVVCAASFSVVVVGAIALFLPPGGLSEFYNHTIGYQISRPDVFSPWALHPGLHPLQTVLEGLALLLVAYTAFVPKARSLATLSALAAAVTIAVQLPAVHWFYYYILWFLPFLLVAVFAREIREPVPPVAEALPDEPPEPAAIEGRSRALAGATT
jgi:hypothetical protein